MHQSSNNFKIYLGNKDFVVYNFSCSSDVVVLGASGRVLAANILEMNGGLLKCSLCDYSYNRKNNVARHIEANHVEMTFQCNLCDKVTPTRHAMYYHKKKMHSGVI